MSVDEGGVAIVIPSWNGRDLLAENLPGVLTAAQAVPTSCEVLVVDDGSEDDSIELLRSRFPQVRIVAHEENRGFGRACLSGAQAASARVLVFLNNDAAVEPDFIAPLLEAVREPGCFAASPILLGSDGVPQGASLNVPYLHRGQIRYRRTDPRELTPSSSRRAPAYTLYPVGAAFAVRKDRFLELEGFDELFAPFYYEDLDLGIRAWRRGWTCKLVAESRVWHEGTETIRHWFPQFAVQTIRKRNRTLCLIKNLTSRRKLASHLVFQLQRVLLASLRLDFRPLVGSARALRRLPMALQRRRAEIAAGGRTLDEIFSIIDAAWRADEPVDADSARLGARLLAE